jgi:hypothetical protein
MPSLQISQRFHDLLFAPPTRVRAGAATATPARYETVARI